MKNKDLSSLLSRAAAAIEDSNALTQEEVAALVEDLVVAAEEVAADTSNTAPLQRYVVEVGYANEYESEGLTVEARDEEEAQRLAVDAFENEGDAGLVAAVYYRLVAEGEEITFDDDDTE